MADDKNATSVNDPGTLEELVDARFLAASQSLSRECKARLEKLKAPRVSAWAHEALKVYQDSIRQRAELWIDCHRSVADEYGSLELRSKQSLGALHKKIMRFAQHGIDGLKREIERRIAAAADGSPGPHSNRYTHLEASVLESVNRGIGVLAAKGQILTTAQVVTRREGIDAHQPDEHEQAVQQPNHRLATRLKAARKEAGHSQIAAAEKLGLSVSAVARIEQCKTPNIRNETWLKITEYIETCRKSLA